MYCIYKVTNQINKKLYIGKTNNFERRKKNHLGHKSEHLFRRALEKYGFDNFKWEIIEDGIQTLQESNERERYWIKYYCAYFRWKNSNGYNMTRGGDGGSDWNLKEVASYDLNGNLLKVFDTISDCTEFYHISGTSSVSRVCGKNRLCKNMMFQYVDDVPQLHIPTYSKPESVRKRKICQLDISGNLIKTYDSISEAENDGFRRSGIIGCINGRYKNSKGFLWCYAENLSQNIGKEKQWVEIYGLDRIVQFSIDGKMVAEYNNCSEAATKAGIKSHKLIHKALSSNTHYCCGYKWYKKKRITPI